MHKGILPILCLVLLPCTSPAPVFMKLGDIKGESTDDAHKDWIDLLSFEIGVETENTDSTIRHRHKPVRIWHELDKATPLMMSQLASGTPVTGEIILEEGRQTATGFSARSIFKLRDVYVREVSLDGDPDRPLVNGVLDYSYAEWHVRQLDAEGRIIDRAATYFDMARGESGIISTAPRILQVGNVEAASGETFTVDVTVLDEDTDFGSLVEDVQVNPLAMEVGPIRWMAPESLRLTLTTNPTFSGQSTVTLTIKDGTDSTSMSFSVYVNDSGTPWGGFLDAYFSEEEQLDPQVSGPIADPDNDQLSTLLEFLFGTNPREFTPAEEQLQRTVFHATPPGGGDPVPTLGLTFFRRIDEPQITLSLYGSTDGKSWTLLRSGEGDPPLYEESSQAAENPLYELVNGSVTPPGSATGYFIRFVGFWN